MWDDDHGDEVIWIRSGRLRDAKSGAVAGPGDVVVVETDVATAFAVIDDTDVVHFGSFDQPAWDLLGPPTGPRGAYIIGVEQRSHTSATLDGDVHVSTRFWADSTRQSSRAAFLEVSGDAGHHAPSHSHSGDEIIYVASGSIRVGQEVLSDNMAIYIPGGQRYRYSAQDPYAFVNFRADASTITLKPGTPGHLETAAALAATPAV
jgi:hypothetical protein